MKDTHTYFLLLQKREMSEELGTVDLFVQSEVEFGAKMGQLLV